MAGVELADPILSQLPFAFDHRPSLDPADYIVSDSNREAHGWVMRWPDWPGAGLALGGATGSGKTHLLRLWQGRSGAIALDLAALGSFADLDERIGEARAIAIDDLGVGSLGEAAERGLFHLYNLMAERRGHLLLVAETAPARWPIQLPDLKSRLATLAAVALAQPDDFLMRAVMAKQFADRQLRVGAEVIAYLAARIERSFAALGATVDGLDRRTMAKGRAVTLAEARAWLSDIENPSIE